MCIQNSSTVARKARNLKKKKNCYSSPFLTGLMFVLFCLLCHSLLSLLLLFFLVVVVVGSCLSIYNVHNIATTIGF